MPFEYRQKQSDGTTDLVERQDLVGDTQCRKRIVRHLANEMRTPAGVSRMLCIARVSDIDADLWVSAYLKSRQTFRRRTSGSFAKLVDLIFS